MPHQPLCFEETAAKAGFSGAVELPAARIQIAEWVRLKCRYGCPEYGRRLSCAPYAPAPAEMRTVVAEYRTALLVWIEADPACDSDEDVRARLQKGLLELEREAFLAGRYRAFALGDGPCTWCSEACPDDHRCRRPDKLRPAMPACGVDVFATASTAGLELAVVTGAETRYRHVGLLLIE